MTPSSTGWKNMTTPPTYKRIAVQATLSLSVQVREGHEEEDLALSMSRYKTYGPYAVNKFRTDTGVVTARISETNTFKWLEPKSTGTTTANSTPSDTRDE